MVTVMLALAATQLSDAERSQMVRDFLGPEQVSNRVDCTSRYVAESGATPPPGRAEIRETYLFPMRPHRQSAEERARLRYVTTLNDGRSFLREGRVESIEWQRWPHFSARIALDYGRVELDSDPSVTGRLAMSGRYRPSHGADIVVRGECRFVPEVPTNEAPAR